MTQKQATSGLDELGKLSEMMDAEVAVTLVRLADCYERFTAAFRRFNSERDGVETMAIFTNALGITPQPTDFDLAAD